MANDKKPEELSEDDLGAVTGGVKGRQSDPGSKIRIGTGGGQFRGGGKRPGSKPPVGSHGGVSPDD